MDSLNSFLSPRMMVGAAIVGIVGAAGVFIFEQVYAEKKRSMLVTEVARLDKQVAAMRADLEALQKLQKTSQLRRAKRKARLRQEAPPAPGNGVGDGDVADAPDRSYASDSEYFTDYQSILGTDGEMDSEEFYDVHSDEDDDTLRESLRNGNVTDLLSDDEPLDKDKLEIAKASLQNNT